MTLLQTLQKDQLLARKNKNEIEASVLTVLYSDAVNIGKNQGNRKTTDDEVIALTKKFVKTAQENLKIYEDSNKTDAVEKTKAELEVLKRYLPQSPSEDEINAKIQDLLATNGWAKEPATVGKVMKELKAQYGSALDGALASKLIKEQLA